MPVRKTGDPVEVYVDGDDSQKGEYRKGTVVKLVRGYGYECVTTDDNGEIRQGTYVFSRVKTIGARTRRSSRGRPANTVLIKQVKREESPSPEREEPKPTERKSRGRAASKKNAPVKEEMNPVEYAWANVEGEAESRTRIRRSRSRSRGRRSDVPVEVEQIADSMRRKSTRIAAKKEAESAPEPVAEEQFSADEEELDQAANSEKSCPWLTKFSQTCQFLKTLSTVYIAPALFFWSFSLFHKFSLNVAERPTQIAFGILVAIGASLHIKPKLKQDTVFFGLITSLIASASFLMPSNFVNDNLSVIGSAAFVFVTAYSLVGNSANKDFKFSFCGLNDYFNSFMFDNSKICARGFARAGEILTLFLLMPTLLHCTGDNMALTAAAFLTIAQTSFKLFNQPDYSADLRGNGFTFAFYHVVYLPFMATLPVLTNLTRDVVALEPSTATLSVAFALISTKLASESKFTQSNLFCLLSTVILAYPTFSCPRFLIVPLLNAIFSWH